MPENIVVPHAREYVYVCMSIYIRSRAHTHSLVCVYVCMEWTVQSNWKVIERRVTNVVDSQFVERQLSSERKDRAECEQCVRVLSVYSQNVFDCVSDCLLSMIDVTYVLNTFYLIDNTHTTGVCRYVYVFVRIDGFCFCYNFIFWLKFVVLASFSAERVSFFILFSILFSRQTSPNFKSLFT